MKLTDAAIRRLKPVSDERRVIRDDGGASLYLTISPSGHKSFMVRFRRPGGKAGKIVLGSFDPHATGNPMKGAALTLAMARQLALEVHRERKSGRDVVADHKAERHRRLFEEEEKRLNSFSAAARDYVEEYARSEQRRWRETARHLGLLYSEEDGEPSTAKNGLAQRWRDRPVADIDAHDIWQVVTEARTVAVPGIEARRNGHSKSQARAFYATLSSMFGWLVRNRRIATNPCQAIERPENPKARDRVLSPSEIRWFWQACDSLDALPIEGRPRVFAPCLKLLLVTGQRLNEVAGMRRDEIAGDAWRIPGQRTKNRRDHIVPLTPLALDLIAGAEPRESSAGFVFTTTGRSPISGWSKMKKEIDAAMLQAAKAEGVKTIQPWRLHDLRRTTITHLGELGVSGEVIELIVNHISGLRGGIAGVYNRSERMAERRGALEAWSSQLVSIVEQGQ